MIIVGAGLSGLIASAMLRGQVDSIHDSQSSIPNNHSALLRFKTSKVGDAVGIPFRKVMVMKASQQWKNPVADAIMYSKKVTGNVMLRSSVTANGEIEERYIAPNDMINQLYQSSRDKFKFDSDIDDALKMAKRYKYPLISTIPMPALMEKIGYENTPKFRSLEGFTITCDLPEFVDICATVYIPDPKINCYRVSITENKLIMEFNMTLHSSVENDDIGWARISIHDALGALGMTEIIGTDWVVKKGKANRMKYNKIVPIDDNDRKRFLLWATENHNVYSLGRFATWRPGMLLDDLVNDVRVIQKMVLGSKNKHYEMSKS
jgi:hypothetical protein